MYWDGIGVSDPALIDVTADALAQGHPTWPHGYQRYRVVRTWQSLILTSEGLGERELFLEMPGAQGWLPEQLRTQWHFDLLTAACRSLVDSGVPAGPVILPVPAPTSAPPQLYAQVMGKPVIPAIVGMDVPGRDTSAHVPLTPITAHEFAHVAGGGALADLIDARVAAGFYHVVVDAPEVTSLLDARLP